MKKEAKTPTTPVQQTLTPVQQSSAIAASSAVLSGSLRRSSRVVKTTNKEEKDKEKDKDSKDKKVYCKCFQMAGLKGFGWEQGSARGSLQLWPENVHM